MSDKTRAESTRLTRLKNSWQREWSKDSREIRLLRRAIREFPNGARYSGVHTRRRAVA